MDDVVVAGTFEADLLLMLLLGLQICFQVFDMSIDIGDSLARSGVMDFNITNRFVFYQ